MLDNPFHEKDFPNTQSKLCLVQTEALSFCPTACYLQEEPDSHLATTLFWVVVENNKVPHTSVLFSRGNLAWRDAINWPNPFLFLCVGTTVSFFLANYFLFIFFLETFQHGFYSTSIVFHCPNHYKHFPDAWLKSLLLVCNVAFSSEQHTLKNIRIASSTSVLVHPYILCSASHNKINSETFRKKLNQTMHSRSPYNDLQPVHTCSLRDQPRTIPKP